MEQNNRPTRQSVFFLASFVVTSSLIAAIFAPLAYADHRKGSFPTYGFLWASDRKGYSGLEYVSSSRCNQGEVDAFDTVKTSTTGTGEMNRWANGISMFRVRCDGGSDMSVDLFIKYLPQSNFLQPSGSYIGGRNVDAVASRDFCSYWGSSYPCGMRPTVQINQDRYFNSSATYQKRQIMHETGHSQSLNHHCNGDSIMNDGSGGCNGGKYTSLNPMIYFPTDRQGVSNIYP